MTGASLRSMRSWNALACSGGLGPIARVAKVMLAVTSRGCATVRGLTGLSRGMRKWDVVEFALCSLAESGGSGDGPIRVGEKMGVIRGLSTPDTPEASPAAEAAPEGTGDGCLLGTESSDVKRGRVTCVALGSVCRRRRNAEPHGWDEIELSSLGRERVGDATAAAAAATASVVAIDSPGTSGGASACEVGAARACAAPGSIICFRKDGRADQRDMCGESERGLRSR
jgi:hypothetical protein